MGQRDPYRRMTGAGRRRCGGPDLNLECRTAVVPRPRCAAGLEKRVGRLQGVQQQGGQQKQRGGRQESKCGGKQKKGARITRCPLGTPGCSSVILA